MASNRRLKYATPRFLTLELFLEIIGLFFNYVTLWLSIQIPKDVSHTWKLRSPLSVAVLPNHDPLSIVTF